MDYYRATAAGFAVLASIAAIKCDTPFDVLCGLMAAAATAFACYGAP